MRERTRGRGENTKRREEFMRRERKLLKDEGIPSRERLREMSHRKRWRGYEGGRIGMGQDEERDRRRQGKGRYTWRM